MSNDVLIIFSLQIETSKLNQVLSSSVKSKYWMFKS